MRTRSFLVAGSALVAAVVTTIPASADDDLVDRAAAHEAAMRIACASPVARRYYARTLRDIDQRRWGLVTGNLADETIELVGDAVYDAASRGDARGEALARFVGEASRADRCGPSETRDAERALYNADRAPPTTMVAGCMSKRIGERRTDLACSLAAAAAASLDGDADVAEGHLADLVASAAFGRVYTGKSLTSSQEDDLYRRFSLALRAVLLAPDDDRPAIVHDVSATFPGIDDDDVKAPCTDDNLVKALSDVSPSSHDAFCIATRPDFDLSKLPVILTEPQGQAHPIHLAELLDQVAELERAIEYDGSRDAHPKGRDELIAEAALCGASLSKAGRASADCSTGAVRSTKAGTFKLAIGGSAWEVVVSGSGAATRLAVSSPDDGSLAALVKGAGAAATMRSDVEALVSHVLLGERPAPKAVRDLAYTALRIRRVAEAIDRAAVDDDEHATLLGIVDALPVIVRNIDNVPLDADPCAAGASSLGRLRCVTRPGGSLRVLLEDAQEARVRDIALRAIAHIAPSDDARVCSQATHGRLLVAFASQLGDEDTAATGDLAKRQLETAAAETNACVTHQGRDPLASGLEILPSPAARGVWNSAYVNAWGADGFRIAPSLDLLIARVRVTRPTSQTYVGVQGSLLDPIAPINELAMRRSDIDYDGQDSLWIEVLRPRLEITFGVPSLSRHLLFSAGVSLRTVAPLREANGVVRYVPVWSSADVRDEKLGSFIETGGGAKWVF